MFLEDGRHQVYGAVHRPRLSGQQSAYVPWSGGPPDFEITVGSGMLRLRVEGGPETELPLPPGEDLFTLAWGRGVFGPLYGKITGTVCVGAEQPQRN